LNDELVGVLTLYSRGLEAFGDDDRRVIEAVAAQIAYSFKRALDFDKTTKRQALIVSSDREAVSFRLGRP
jgi:GAF domain-containing protein